MNLLMETAMRITKRYCRLLCAIPLMAGVLAVAAPSALADSVYPPGWNVPNQHVGPILYDFRPGCWGDTNRYWPEQKTCREGTPRSRPMSYGTVLYQFTAGGKRLHRVQETSQLDEIMAEAR